MSKPKRSTKLEYLEAQRRCVEKSEDDPDLKIVLLYELDEEIEEEKRKAKPS
jgi:hypothetical protein